MNLLIALFFSSATIAQAAPRPACAYLLWPAATQIGSAQFPLRTGRLPLPLGQRTFATVGAALTYLRAHPDLPGGADLTNLTVPPGHLIYLSEFGPTLWSHADFNDWVALVTRTGRAPAKAREVVLRLGFGERVAGLSEAVHRRVRAAMVIYLEAERAAEAAGLRAAVNNGLHPAEPNLGVSQFTGDYGPKFTPPETAKLSQVQKALLAHDVLLAGLKAHAETTRELNADVPSLAIPFERRRVDALDVDAEAAVLTVRALLREALVRRRVTRGRTFANILREDQLFVLSLYPELMPIWPQLPRWDVEASQLRFKLYDSELRSPELSYGGQILTLLIDREDSELGEAPFAEASQVRLALHRPGLARAPDLRGARRLLEDDFIAFARRFDPKLATLPTLEIVPVGELGYLKAPTAANAVVIAFFAYLMERHPLHHPSN